MAKYKRLLIQQQTVSEGNYTNVGKVIDTQEAFHVVCQSFPYKHLPETKELPKRDWYDEHGEDVYMPSDGQRFKAYDVDAKFLYVGTEANMKTELKNFIDFLYGRNENGSPRLAVYDEYTKTGRRGNTCERGQQRTARIRQCQQRRNRRIQYQVQSDRPDNKHNTEYYNTTVTIWPTQTH